MRRWWKPLLMAGGLVLGLALFSASRFAVWPFGPKWVRVVRSGGEPVWNTVVVLERPGADDSDFQGTTESSGWIGIPHDAIRHGQEMLVIAAGCGILRDRLPSGYRVELPPAVPVTLRLEGDFQLPTPPASLALEVEPVGVREGLRFALQSAVAPADYWQLAELERIPVPRWFGIDPETRSVRILVPCPGSWQLSWSVMVTERRGGGIQSGGSGPSETIPIEIPEGGGSVSFSIDREEIERYLSR